MSNEVAALIQIVFIILWIALLIANMHLQKNIKKLNNQIKEELEKNINMHRRIIEKLKKINHNGKLN